MRDYSLDFVKISDVDDAKEFLSDCNSFCHLRVSLHNNGKFTDEKLETLKTFIANKKIVEDNVKEIAFSVPFEKIPRKVFEELLNFRSAFPNIKMFVNVYHMLKNGKVEYNEFKEWDIDAVLKANNAIDKVCDKIKESNLTPVEALAYIHKFVSSVTKYNAGDDRYWDSDDQHFVGAFTRKKEFVCAGFASLEKEIIDSLNMPGLKCEIVSVEVFNRDKMVQESHARCMLEIDDKTYGITRTAFDDPTWDNDDENLKNAKYAHFLMPKITHEDDVSYKYDYSNLAQMTSQNKNLKQYQYLYPHIDYKSKNDFPIEQVLVEKIHFNMLNKTTKKSCSEIYADLQQMAKESYKEQTLRKFKGALKQETLILSKEEAKKLYTKNENQNRNSSEIER